MVLLLLPWKQREREKCNSAASNQLSSFQIKLNDIMKKQCVVQWWDNARVAPILKKNKNLKSWLSIKKYLIQQITYLVSSQFGYCLDFVAKKELGLS